MKFIVSVILVMILAFAFGLYLPWWSIAAAAFTVAVAIKQKPLNAFLFGFVALFLLWGILAWMKDAANDNLLGSKMATLILKTDNSLLLVLTTALIGAVISGLAALSGSLLRSVIKTKY